MKAIITRTMNGYTLKTEEGICVFEDTILDHSGEREAWVSLLRELTEVIGPRQEAFKRLGEIRINLVDGHEYEKEPA